jgi:hypothetical protein
MSAQVCSHGRTRRCATNLSQKETTAPRVTDSIVGNVHAQDRGYCFIRLAHYRYDLGTHACLTACYLLSL